MPRYVMITGTMLLAIISIIGFISISLLSINPYVRSWDEVDFVLGLQRYDLLQMQPHFPGYPYFIVGASLLNQWVGDPVRALALFNIGAAVSSVIPIMLLARRCTLNGQGILLASWVLTSPYLWMMTVRPMSETAGIAVLWWYLWSIRTAIERPDSRSWHAVVLVLFGLLMGIRLSFFPFGLALLLLWWQQYRQEGRQTIRMRRLWLSVAAACALQLVWVMGLALSEGTLSGFWKLSAAFVEGHFSQWGGGIASSPMPLGSRVRQLLINNLLGDALLARSFVGAILMSLLGIVALVGKRLWLLETGDNPALTEVGKRSTVANQRFWLSLGFSVILYMIWALFGQNIEKPRHIAPVIGPLLLFVYAAAINKANLLWKTDRAAWFSRGSWQSLIIYSLLLAVIVNQWVYGAALLRRQAVEIPAVYQLHEYVRQIKEPFVLYTWEETRVLQFLQAGYDHNKIYTYGYFKAVIAAQPERRVLLTDHVVEGFERQGQSIRAHVKLLAEFKSEALFEPVYPVINLYEWVRES